MYFNDKCYTYLHSATGSYPYLDISICSPGICVDFKWKVEDYRHYSDHFPVVTTETGPSVQVRLRRRLLHKENWNLFQM